MAALGIRGMIFCRRHMAALVLNGLSTRRLVCTFSCVFGELDSLGEHLTTFLMSTHCSNEAKLIHVT